MVEDCPARNAAECLKIDCQNLGYYEKHYIEGQGCSHFWKITGSKKGEQK